jgi:hypothetical protein
MKPTRLAAALLTLALTPAVAAAGTYYDATPTEATTGTQAANQSPWITTTSGALSGSHLNIHGNVSDHFGSGWWGGGYTGDYQLWDWQSGTSDLIVAGASLRVLGKLFFVEKEVANLSVGTHNWGSNVANGSVVIMGKTVKNWFLTDQALQETYEKSTNFFDKSYGIDVFGFNVSFTAKSHGTSSWFPTSRWPTPAPRSTSRRRPASM